MSNRPAVEWPTLFLILGCYAAMALGTTVLARLSLPSAILVTAVSVSLHSSLVHEVIHGHPFKNRWLNEVLVFPAVGVIVPYLRFRETHLAHHWDENLTDPYDDPESNFWDPNVWTGLCAWKRRVMAWNNTLAGRVIIGPIIGTLGFLGLEWRAWRGGDRRVLTGWGWHIPALGPVAIWLVWVADMPVWAYLAAVYISHSLQKIRTYLEHRAHERARGRTVIVEDRGPLSLLFLNNNLHAVHHAHPNRAWYELPAMYRRHKAQYLSRNDGYVYRSYAEIFGRYFRRAKDPVPHPLWRPPTQ